MLGARRGVVGAVVLLAGLAPAASAAVKPITGSAGTHATGLRFTAQTVVVPSAVVASSLVSVSPDGARYTFRGDPAPVGDLVPGRVMLLQGYAVRKVTRISKGASRTVVTTTPAGITQLIEDGTLSWSRPTDFSHAYAYGGSSVPPERARDAGVASVPARFGLAALAHAITLKGKTSSYTYKVTFTPEGKRVGLDITIGKSSPVDVSVTISGTLSGVGTSGRIAVASGHLKTAQLAASGLKGQFKLSYSFKPISQFGLGRAGGVKIELPAEITVPFAAGPVPLFIGIKTAFFASVGFSSFDQAVQGDYTISYDGHGGFTTSSSGATSAKGFLQGLEKIILDAADAVRKGPLTVIFGAQVPQLELGLGVKGLNVGGFVTLIADTGVSTYGNGCDTRGLLLQASTGAEASFFGFSTPLGSATLFKKELSASYPRGCGTFPGFG